MRYFTFSLAAGAALMASGLTAQTRLTPGDSIVVSYRIADADRLSVVEGLYRGLSAESVLVVPKTSPEMASIPFHEVDMLGVRRSQHQGTSFALLGALAGIVAGAIDYSKQPKCGDSCWVLGDDQALALSLLFGGGAGAALGYGIGKTFKKTETQWLSKDELRGLRVLVNATNGVGFTASLVLGGGS